MAENKIAKIPVASHGLHRHPYNYPWLSSINFGDVMPCYYNPLRKSEKDKLKGGMFSQLMPIAHNAFATGRYNFKAIFVPYKFVWRPFYAFDQQVKYYSNGESFIPGRYPYVNDSNLSGAFCNLYGDDSHASANDYDVALYVNSTTTNYYHISDAGRRVLRILGALGCMPTFSTADKTTMNILPLMCYIKAFSDYYFPNNYVGSAEYQNLSLFFERDDVDFTDDVSDLLRALELCSLNFYENSVFDLAFDNPLKPNDAVTNPPINIKDQSVLDNSNVGELTTQIANEDVPAVSLNDSKVPAFTKYILDALESVSLWMKRRQISGARIIDKFLVSRGVSLPNDSARISYFLGQRNIEIEVSGVENNTDVNLGELAGRGVSSTGNSPLSFDCAADDDGIFFVIVSPIPDCNFPIYRDGFSMRKTFLDNYNPEFDKLGNAAVSMRNVFNTVNGHANHTFQGDDGENVFGFLSQYWDEIQEKPRLLGDFSLPSRGMLELSAYHTFRLLNWDVSHSPFSEGFAHSFQYMRMLDAVQYQRLFYSSEQENLMLFLRWYGAAYKEKLPLGDSYDWDDDEMNRKVSVVAGGSQK